MMRSVILGVGGATGKKPVPNEKLLCLIKDRGCEPPTLDWIKARTGILSRFFAEPHESTATLAAEAASAALKDAALTIHDIDAIIVATCTPEYGGTPSTACVAQKLLGGNSLPAFDINAACTGFVYGLVLANSLCRTQYEKILVIGSETLSRIVDFSDQKTSSLPGDGAGAVVVGKNENTDFGIIDACIFSSGNTEILVIPAGGSRQPASHETIEKKEHYLKMDGKEVFRFAVNICCETIQKLCERNTITLNDISHIFLHQANLRIIESVAQRLNVPQEKFFNTISEYGNTSAASIPLGLARAKSENRLCAGDKILLVGFGGGLTWGGMFLRWGS